MKYYFLQIRTDPQNSTKIDFYINRFEEDKQQAE